MNLIHLMSLFKLLN